MNVSNIKAEALDTPLEISKKTVVINHFKQPHQQQQQQQQEQDSKLFKDSTIKLAPLSRKQNTSPDLNDDIINNDLLSNSKFLNRPNLQRKSSSLLIKGNSFVFKDISSQIKNTEKLIDIAKLKSETIKQKQQLPLNRVINDTNNNEMEKLISKSQNFYTNSVSQLKYSQSMKLKQITNRSISDSNNNNNNSLATTTTSTTLNNYNKNSKSIENFKIPKIKLRFTITESDLKYVDYSRNRAQITQSNIDDQQKQQQQRLEFRLNKLNDYNNRNNSLFKNFEHIKPSSMLNTKLKPIQTKNDPKQQQQQVPDRILNKCVREELGLLDDSDDNEFDYFDNEDEIFL
jgi:hypothetical protein